jgi:hypothetical protein
MENQIPQIATKEFNDLASACFGGKPKQETIEEYFLDNIKNVLQFKNDAQAIRFMEKYFEAKQENCCTPIGQIKRYVDCKGCDRKPNQETLEEAFEKWSEVQESYDKLDVLKFGAKWQQEISYSEEEVLEFTQTMIMQYKFGNTNIEQMDLLKETLQQFKKK